MDKGRVMVYAPDHPDARLLGGKYIYEYRMVAEQVVGRRLRSDEIVHHIDGDPSNNRPENLAVMTPSEHIRVHLPGKHGRPDAKRNAMGRFA
jgi:hypothetical protein